MGKKKKRKPPRKISVEGAGRHCLAVFLINTRDEKGRPKLVTFIHEEQEIELAGGEEFGTAYVHHSQFPGS